jgi:hypothetical protein
MARKDKEAKAKLVKIVVAAVLVVLIGGAFVYSKVKERKETAAIAAAWTVTGEPCPTVAAAAAPPIKGLVYEGVTFQRDKGAINCNSIQPGGTGAAVPVCMFMGPGNLRIATATTTVNYAPPAGVPATVSIREGGKPECVMHFNRALFN